ncbi:MULTISPECIES: thymidine kinase [Sphingobacterium]|jgi:thymidine kinase|uniref:Thymidine kinase n=1 Tax=Sphingobacterium litopenaei TaxID=2763500 RepID=A0ABR7YGD0_9SPHI|nr:MULTISPECIES: thymidine kinase [Sphingobacterium]MBD1430294.1 thymidine kinase [Sphingobacterium litopenaei]NGM74465.1 thymidine kinase [Sphingobacterium sp. SGL-16]
MLFSEQYFSQRDRQVGSIEVICGSMFSGKTEELIRRMKRAQFAKLPVEIFKPAIDIRYDEKEVVSHDSNSIPSTPVEHSSAILLLGGDAKVVGIDEAQFFDDELPNVCIQLANRGVRVIVAGLDMDYQGRPFGPMPNIMAVAEDVYKVHAVCVKCGAPANYSYRFTKNDNVVLLGEKESYEPRCRHCYYIDEDK